jgi:hypothetical protein
MTSLTFYGGVNEISGNKILLEDKDTRVFLDFGKGFSRRAAAIGVGISILISQIKRRKMFRRKKLLDTIEKDMRWVSGILDSKPSMTLSGKLDSLHLWDEETYETKRNIFHRDLHYQYIEEFFERIRIRDDALRRNETESLEKLNRDLKEHIRSRPSDYAIEMYYTLLDRRPAMSRRRKIVYEVITIGTAAITVAVFITVILNVTD